jgi:acyl dehydratase
MSVPWQQRWFDDYAVGEVFEFGDQLVTEAEIIEFAQRYDPQPFHLSAQAGAASHFGGLVASGWMTGCLLMRMGCDHFISPRASMGSPGMDELRWLKPVRPGDRLRARVEVLSLRVSQSKPDRGLMNLAQSCINQQGETVLTMRTMAMLLRKPGAAQA